MPLQNAAKKKGILWEVVRHRNVKVRSIVMKFNYWENIYSRQLRLKTKKLLFALVFP